MSKDTEEAKNNENSFFNNFINWISGGSTTEGS